MPNTGLCAHNTHGEVEDEDEDNSDNMDDDDDVNVDDDDHDGEGGDNDGDDGGGDGTKSLLSMDYVPSTLQSAFIYFSNSFSPHNHLMRKGLLSLNPSFASCVVLGKVFHLSEPQFPHL